jgi:molybdopterin/thiamine biosynthesis adenylyltransferase
MNDLKIVKPIDGGIKASNHIMNKVYTAFDVFRNQHNFSDPMYYALPRVMILGCGSTGSHIAENLSRLGILEFVLVDGDIIQPHNCMSSSYPIADIYEKYWTDDAFYTFLAKYNSNSVLADRIPYKATVLKDRLLKINPLSTINNHTRFITKMDMNLFSIENVQEFISNSRSRVSLITTNDRLWADAYNLDKDEFQKTLNDWVKTVTTFNNISWLLPNMFDGYYYLGHKRYIYAIDELSSYNNLEDHDEKQKSIMSDNTIYNDTTFSHLFHDYQDLVILCADNFEARFNTLHQLRYFYQIVHNPVYRGTEESNEVKTVFPVIDTRVGNTIEGEIAIFDLLNEDQFKSWINSVLDQTQNSADDVYDFKYNVRKVEDIKFVNGSANVCGDTMSVMSALQTASLTVNIIAHLYKNSEIPLMDKVDKYHRFKLGTNANKYSRYFMTEDKI